MHIMKIFYQSNTHLILRYNLKDNAANQGQSMIHKQLIKATNIIALTSILLLIYCVFAIILIVVFDLKISQTNIKNIFEMSLFGILIMLVGSFILNVMLNLTYITKQKEYPTKIINDTQPTQTSLKRYVGAIIMVFLLLVVGLFFGDYSLRHKRFALMEQSAQQLIQSHHDGLAFLEKYRFDEAWIKQVLLQIEILQATNTNIRQTTIITPDKIGDNSVYLAFGESKSVPTHTGTPSQIDISNHNITYLDTQTTDGTKEYLKKSDFIFTTDTTTKTILDEMFDGRTTPHQSLQNGDYEMFYPYQINGKTVAVLYFYD